MKIYKRKITNEDMKNIASYMDEENEEYHCGSFWKTDGDLKNCTIKDIIERGKDEF